MHFASQEKTHRLNFQPPALCFFHLNTFLQGNLYFSFSNNRLTPALASQNWTILSSFATKLNNQNHSIMINKAQEQLIRNVQFRLIKTIQILKPLLHKIGQFRNLSEKFLYKSWPFLCLGGVHFCFPLETVFFQLQTVHLNTVSLFLLLFMNFCQYCWQWWGLKWHWISFWHHPEPMHGTFMSS